MAELSQSFLGRGWAFGASGVGTTDDGRVAEASGEDKIRQSIWLILSTAPGERIARPDFGCRIHDLVFASRAPGTLGDVARGVTEALGRWEPRIDVISVDAAPDPSDSTGVLVSITFVVRATNSRVNLVYPFYLAT